MTASSAFCGPSAAYLISDAGTFDERGTVKEFRTKVVASDRLRIAFVMAGRNCIVFDDDGGRFSPAEDAQKLLDEAAGQREFLISLPGLMRDLYEVAERAGGATFQFTIGLWNAVDCQAETYVIGTPGHTFPDLQPFTLAGVKAIAMPPVDRALWPAGKVTADDARTILEAQRGHRDEGGAVRVGGFGELTTIDTAGVRTELVRSWPDRIGRPIQPAGLMQRFRGLLERS